MANKISYLESNGKYLIMKEDGTSETVNSKEEFNEYLTKNKCEIVS